MAENIIYGMGAIPSGYDENDYGMEKVDIMMATTYPAEYTVKYLPNIYNQMNVGQCCAFSLSKIKESQELKERGVRTKFSHSFIYANRATTDYQSEGMMPREALRRLSKYGTCEFNEFPLLDTYPNCKAQLDSRINELLPQGLSQRINTYVRLKTNEEIMSFLMSEEIPVLIGMLLYENFYYPVNGVIPMPSGNQIGGHAMVLCGWKLINGKQHWIVSNSWSEQWGDNGYCYIPFEIPFMEVWGVTDRKANEEIAIPQTIVFVLDTPTMYTDDKVITMDCNPTVINGRTLIPVRYLAETLGFKVGYEVKPDGRKVVTLKNGGEIIK